MKRILFMSDCYALKTGYACVARAISSYLHSTGKYNLAYCSWFFNHGKRDEFGPPPFIEFTTAKMHDNCCGRQKVIEKYYPDGKVEYYRNENSIAMIPLPNDRPFCKSDNVMQHDRYAYESLPAIIQHFKPDIVWTLGDIWMQYFVQYMPHRKSFKWVCYNAIDSAPSPHITIQGDQVINWPMTLKNPDELMMFCKFGLDTINATSVKYGYGKIANKYIWHGCDLSTYKPLSDQERKDYKKKVFGFGDDVFLVGFFSRNQPRKALHKVFEAVRRFKDKGYETGKKLKVYFHTPIRDIGWNCENLVSWYDLQDTVILNKDLQIGGGVSEPALNKLYNICDITTLPSRGEGWSLMTSESICAGVPSLVSDYSAHADWGRNHGIELIKIQALDAEPITNQERAIVDVEDYADKIKILYDNKNGRLDELRKQCLDFRSDLSWTKITRQWEDLFDSINISDNQPYRDIIYKPIEFNIPVIPVDPVNTPFELVEIK